MKVYRNNAINQIAGSARAGSNSESLSPGQKFSDEDSMSLEMIGAFSGKKPLHWEFAWSRHQSIGQCLVEMSFVNGSCG